MKLFIQLDFIGTLTMGGYRVGPVRSDLSNILYSNAEVAAHRRIQLDSLTFRTTLRRIVLLTFLTFHHQFQV